MNAALRYLLSAVEHARYASARVCAMLSAAIAKLARILALPQVESLP